MPLFGQRLKELRQARGLLQKELAGQLGVSRNTLASWEAGYRTPEMAAAQRLADYFQVSLDYLLGRSEVSTLAAEAPSSYQPPGADGGGEAVTPVRAAVISEIRDAESLFAPGNVEGYRPLPIPPDEAGECFFWRVRGNSMTAARIHEGDLVLIRRQGKVEDGDIALVLVNGEPTLQRVYRANDKWLLQPDNLGGRPVLVSREQIKIVGRVIHVQFDPK
ncbi:MAG TPA: helix-turn-helix domain-containing protein [Firmicutes bacterium]|nr:helix-turn-helix domain-containing protein [Bacillota bacterium]